LNRQAERVAPISLRPAVADDALCLGVLATQVFLDTYATGGIRPTLAREVQAAFSTEACRAFIAAPGSLVRVAEVDGHLIGFSQLALAARHELAPEGAQAELVRLYVQEPFTGRGVSSRLLREAEGAAAVAGSTVLWLTPWAENARALGFYARHGYVDHGLAWYRFEDEAYENRLLAKRLPAHQR
jgi:GNAT superfamily N-acetyltransferase